MLQRSTMKIKLSALQAKVQFRPPGYLDDCIAHGLVDGAFIEFSDDQWRYLCRKYRMLEPTAEDLAENYAAATVAPMQKGFEIIQEDEYKQRLSICVHCEAYNDEQCRVCGNNPIRLYWRHAKCPRGKWNSIDNSIKH